MPGIIQDIKQVLAQARERVAREVNNELLSTYWNIGRIICEYERSAPNRADYGKQTLKELSKELTQEFAGVWKRLFPLQLAKYAPALSDLSKMPDTVWQIDLVPLL